VESMLKKSTVTLTFFVCLAWTSIFANTQTPAEMEFADLVRKADSSFNLGDYQVSERYLSEANSVLARNPEINKILQGNFNTVLGKHYMDKSLDTSLGYFNKALTLLSDDRSSKAETELFVAIAYYYAGDYRTAKGYLASSKEVFLASKNNENLAQVLNNEGVIAFMEGDAETATNLCTQALSINRGIENSLNASKNQQNIDFFNGRTSLNFDNKYDYNTGSKKPIRKDGGGGTSGSGTGVGTGGGGTVIVGGGGFSQ
jgi:tetratricopeptide (TPR) repeat protein